MTSTPYLNYRTFEAVTTSFEGPSSLQLGALKLTFSTCARKTLAVKLHQPGLWDACRAAHALCGKKPGPGSPSSSTGWICHWQDSCFGQWSSAWWPVQARCRKPSQDGHPLASFYSCQLSCHWFTASETPYSNAFCCREPCLQYCSPTLVASSADSRQILCFQPIPGESFWTAACQRRGCSQARAPFVHVQPSASSTSRAWRSSTCLTWRRRY